MKEISNDTLIKLGVKRIPRFRYFTTEEGRIYVYTNKTGYREVHPFYDKYKLYNIITLGNKKMLWHRVILINYIDQPEDKPDCNHINGNKLDNRLENLEWCTKSHNVMEAQRLGLKPTKKFYQFREDGTLVKIRNSKHEAASKLGYTVLNTTRYKSNGVMYTRAKGYRWNTENIFPEARVNK